MTMTLATALGAGALIGTGAATLALGLLPARRWLVDDLAALQAPPPAAHPMPATTGPGDAHWPARLGRPAARVLLHLGLPRPAMARDLALLGTPATDHLAKQAVLAATGLLVAPLLVILTGIGGPGSALVAAAAAGACGYWLADRRARRAATGCRRSLRHALSAYLDLVVLAADAGAGIDQALTDSAAVCHGWGAERIRGALRTAHLTRTTAWTAFAELGAETGVAELTELSATAGLAGTEGARVRASLSARAAAVRSRLLAETETAANAATERMSVPMFVLATGFLLLIAYPALAGVLLAI